MAEESKKSIGGGIATLVDSSNADKLKQEFYSKNLNHNFDLWNHQLNPKVLGTKQFFDAYRSAYDANTPKALKNQDFYKGIATGILNDPTTVTDLRERNRSGDLASLSSYFKEVADYGLAGEKAKAAAAGLGGYGRGLSDVIASSNRISSNFAPILNNIYSRIGPDALAAYNAGKGWDQYRMAQFAQDPLTGYLDTATAGRAIAPYYTKLGMINAPLQTLGNLGGMYRNNSAGFSVEKGLGSRLDDFDQGHMNAMQNAASIYSSLYGGGMMGGGGMGGGMGGGGGGGMDISSLMKMYGGGQGGSYGGMSPSQDQNWMNEFNGTPYNVAPAGSIPNYGQPTNVNPWYNNSPALQSMYA